MNDYMQNLVGKKVAVYGAGPAGSTVFAKLAGYNDTEEWYEDQDTGEFYARFPRGKYDVKPYREREE